MWSAACVGKNSQCVTYNQHIHSALLSPNTDYLSVKLMLCCTNLCGQNTFPKEEKFKLTLKQVGLTCWFSGHADQNQGGRGPVGAVEM